MTLRGDWPQRRKEAVARIRKLAAGTAKAGGRLLVLPLRVHGLGPYASVLKDTPYLADGKGPLPRPLVGEWLKRQAAETFRPPAGGTRPRRSTERSVDGSEAKPP